MRHLWTAMSAEAQADSSGEPPRFINVPWPIEDGLEPEMEAGFDELLTRLRSAGIEIEQRPLPESFPDLLRAARAINNYEGARENRRRYEEHGAAIGTKLAALVEDGLAMPEATYHQAQETVAMTRDVFETSVRDGALWLVPSAPGRAPEGLATTGDPRCNAPFTAMGVPALSLPFKRTAEGLPLGCQIVGPNGGEALVLAAAGHCEVLLREAAAAG
jgi:Asp-tRNA(Asn)/Glu-tRNA(Gln) amidotransferase A subunit family amidase